jgi:thiamine transporter
MRTSQKQLRKMVLTASLVTMGIVLDIIISIIPGLNFGMPFGGKFFGISMFPIILIGLTCGLSYGIIGSLVFSLYNFGIDYISTLASIDAIISSFTDSGFTGLQWLLIVFFDYVIPFAGFGLSGLFHKSFNKLSSVFKAIALTSFIRLVSSSINGVIIWGGSIEDLKNNVYEIDNPLSDFIVNMYKFFGESVLLYSITYNLIYILSTAICVGLIFWQTHERLYDVSNQLLVETKA